MTWYEYTNTAPTLSSNTNSMGLDITLDSGILQAMTLPHCDIAVEDQEIRLILSISNGSKMSLHQKADDSTPGVLIREITNSCAIHLMFDYDNSKWRIVSDDKIRAIEDEEHHLTALSGNRVKDQDGDLIEPSGVDVVGISSINGKNPVLSDSGDISVSTINGVAPLLAGAAGTFSSVSASNVSASGNVSAGGDVSVSGNISISGNATINGDLNLAGGGSYVKKYVITPSSSNNLYDILCDLYGMISANAGAQKDIYMTLAYGYDPHNWKTFTTWYTTASYNIGGWWGNDHGYQTERRESFLSDTSLFNGQEIIFYV